jgi:pimeloyl-ACP methyl ester carboxylesterase
LSSRSRGFSSRLLAGLAAGLLAASAAPAAEEILLDTGAGQLSGTLERPSSKPAVCALLIAGSAPTDRDGNQPDLVNDSLKQLALGLAERGVCTLRYDKRGIGASGIAGADERKLRFDDHVADATAWMARLKRSGGAARVALVGHGEGALVALLAAQREKPSAIVSIAGAGRPAAELMREQLAGLPVESRRRGEYILNELVLERPVAQIPTDFGALFRPSVQPYLISWFRYNPASEIRTADAPVLIVQGGADIQVPVAEARILAASNPRATLRVFPEVNHVLKRVTSPLEQRAAYTSPAVPIEPAVVEAIAAFLLRP